MLGDGPRHKFMEWPAALYSSCPLDRVEVGGTLIGRAVYAVYTVHVGGWFSIGIVDEDEVAFGAEATLIWGEPEVTAKPTVELHEQVPVRVTMRRSALG
jgi:hypothetical protein